MVLLVTLVYLIQLKTLSLSYTGHDDHDGASINFSEGWGGGGGQSCSIYNFARAAKLKFVYFYVKCNGFVVPYNAFLNLLLHYILWIFQVVEIIGGGGGKRYVCPPPNIFMGGGGGSDSPPGSTPLTDHLKCWIGLAVEFQELWIIKKETNKKNPE